MSYHCAKTEGKLTLNKQPSPQWCSWVVEYPAGSAPTSRRSTPPAPPALEAQSLCRVCWLPHGLALFSAVWVKENVWMYKVFPRLVTGRASTRPQRRGSGRMTFKGNRQRAWGNNEMDIIFFNTMRQDNFNILKPDKLRWFYATKVQWKKTTIVIPEYLGS